MDATYMKNFEQGAQIQEFSMNPTFFEALL